MTADLTSKQRFVAAMAVLSETFNRPLSDGAVEGYWLVLNDLSSEDLGRAIKRALSEAKFMPTPGELLTFAGHDQRQAQAALIAQSWEAIRTAMRKYGYTTSVDFGSLVNAVVRNLGGWLELCAKTIDELVWVRKDFERLYEAFSAKPLDGINGDPLRGQFGGAPVRIAIGGVVAPLQIADGKRSAVADLVRGIATGQNRLEER
jgi:hypothetical protein